MPADEVKLLSGFAPVVAPGARILVLGTMPGAVSLAQARYYANPRNAFWPIAAELFGVDASAPYEARLKALKTAGVALWDVLANCERPGSLDAAIVTQSVVANDFAAFFQAYPGIEIVAFNGAKAAQLYRRHVLPGLSGPAPRYLSLPSTSPAHAAQNLAAKIEAWRAVLQPF